MKIPGIEYPVVKGKDNNFYLTKSFDKSNNSAGWVFMEYTNKADETDKNTIIYGHNRKDGSMFGTLKKVLTEEWYNNENNKFITYITENGSYTYEVFSVYKIESENYYLKTSFKEKEFQEFVNTLKARSVKNFDVEVTEEDHILTLSTCADNNKYRVVLHAKRTSI